MTTTEETKTTVAKRDHHRKTPTGYALRRRRLEAVGTERVTTWRGRPCIGGGCAGHGESVKTAWDAATVPCVPAKGYGKLRRAKGGAK